MSGKQRRRVEALESVAGNMPRTIVITAKDRDDDVTGLTSWAGTLTRREGETLDGLMVRADQLARPDSPATCWTVTLD